MRNNTIIKFIIVFSVILTAFWGSTRVASTHQFLGPVHEPDINAPNDALIAYLPLVNNNACLSETIESPFSIEIAALNQITTTVASSEGQGMSEEQFYAWYDQAFPTLLDRLKESGAGYTRIFISWADIEPTAPISGTPIYDSVGWNWYDTQLLKVAQAGIKTIAIIGTVPAWANDFGVVCPPISPDHQADYQRFLTDLVNRYDQPPYNVKHWEIFNEADNTTVGRASSHACWGNYGGIIDPGQVVTYTQIVTYAQILSVSHSVIKSIDLGATVLMSGLAYDGFTPAGPYNRYFLDDVMTAGGADYLDVLNFHYFPFFSSEWERWNPPNSPPTCGIIDDGVGLTYDASGIDIIAKTKHITNRMSTCFGVNKQAWLTEAGAPGIVTDTVSLANQAHYVIQVYARGLAAGLQNITWFALVLPDEPNGSGLLNSTDFSPKPAYYAYKTMVSELTNFRYKQTLPITGGEAYVFQNNCQGEKTVAWGDNIPLTFSPATSLRVVDYLGNESLIQDGGAGDGDGTQNGVIQITLTSDPVFISVTGQ